MKIKSVRKKPALQYSTIKKEQKQVFIKRFLKRNLADVGMLNAMHWLMKYTDNLCHAHSDTHSITWPHYSTTIPT